MPENPIYNFLKDNDLTDKTSQEFSDHYSNRENVEPLFNFFVDNDLTEKGFEDFYLKYFKKKDLISGLEGEKEALPSVGKMHEPIEPVKEEGFRKVEPKDLIIEEPEEIQALEFDENKLIEYQKSEAKKRHERVAQYKIFIDQKLPEVESELEEVTNLYEQNQNELRALMFKGDRRNPEEEKRYNELYPQMQDWFDKNVNLSTTRDLLDKSRRYIETSDAGILESMYKSKSLGNFISLGLGEVLGDFDVLATAKKYQSGEPLNEDEQMKLFAYGLNQLVNENVEQGLKSMIGSGIVETIPFMVQFALSGPTSTVAKESAEMAVKSALKKVTKDKLVSIISKTAGALTGAVVRTPQLLDFYGGIAERQIGVIKPEIAEDGTLRGIPLEETQLSPLQATKKSFLSTLVTASTESFGEGFDKLLTPLIKKIPYNPMVFRISNNTIRQVKSATGFQSWMSEFIEEIFEGYGQAAVTREQKLSDVWDNKQMLATLITTGIISGHFSGVDFLLRNNSENKTSAIRDLRNSEQVLGAAKVTEIDKILKGDDINTNVSQLDLYIKEAISNGATSEDIKNILNYVGNVSKLNSLSDVEIYGKEELLKEKEVPGEEVKPEAEIVAKEEVPVVEEEVVKPEAEIVAEEEIVKPKEKEYEKEKVQKEELKEAEKPTEAGIPIEKEKFKSEKDEILTSGKYEPLRNLVEESKTSGEFVKKFRESKFDPEIQDKFFKAYNVGVKEEGAMTMNMAAKTFKKDFELQKAVPGYKKTSEQRYKADELGKILDKVKNKEELTTPEKKIWREEQKSPSGYLFDYEGNLKPKKTGYAKEYESIQMRERRAEEGQIKGISDKDLSNIYRSKLQDREKEQKKSIQEIGDIGIKDKSQLINDSESVNELDYLLSTNQVAPSTEFNTKKSQLESSGKIEDINGRISKIEFQRAYSVDQKIGKLLENELGADRVSELRKKKGELLEDISSSLGRLANLKYAIGEGGKRPNMAKEIAKVIRNLGEVGLINLELGTRQAIAKLKEIIGNENKEAIKEIDNNISEIEKELSRPIEEIEKEEVIAEEREIEEIAAKEPEVEREVPEGKKRRKAAEQILKNRKIKEEIKKGLSEDSINYIPISNEVTTSEAQAIIDVKKAITGNLDQSIIDVTNTNNAIAPRIRVVMAELLIQDLNKEIDQAKGEQKEKLKNDAIHVAESIVKFGTELGQGVQAFNIWSKLNEETIVAKFNDDLEKIGKRKLTPEEEGKLRDYAKKVRKAKEGFQKVKAIHEMLAYQMRLEGIKWNDVGMSVWYAHVLSGHSTQVLNAMANIAETAGEVLTSMVYNPKRAPWLLKGLFSGYGRGLLEAWSVLKTGYAPVKSIKFDNIKDKPGVLEAYQGFKMFKRYWNPFRFHKYVTRVMSAVDTFFYHGLKNMRAYELAHMEINSKGKSISSVDKLINEKLSHTKERKAKAREIAALEATENIDLLKVEKAKLNKDLKKEKDPDKKEVINKEIDRVNKEIKEGPAYKIGGLDYKRRVWEIMEQTIPDESLVDMDNFASKGTFNYDTEGRLGMVTDGVAALSNKKGLRALKFVIPFTRIVSNVANRYLDWTPVGFYRGAKGGIGPSPRSEFNKSKYSKAYTREEQTKEFIKASLGTLAAATLFMLSKGEDEDDETQGPFEITAAGTGDYRKNYNLREVGWQPYSIKIKDKWYSFANTPLAIPLTVIGTIKDLGKYRGENLKNKTTSDKISMVVWNTFKYFTDLTFLKSLSEFLSYFSEEDSSKASKYFERLGAGALKSFVIPNEFTQVSRQVQSTMDLPIKEANTLWQQFYRDMPIARRGLNDMVNGLGEPVIPNTRRYVSDVEFDPIWELIVENNAWIMKPSKQVRVYDLKTGDERTINDDEYYQYSKLRGEKLKSSIEGNFEELKTMNKEDVNKLIDDYKNKASKEAKSELLLGKVSYGLHKIKKENPQAFEALQEYKGFFEPTSSKSIWVSRERRFLDKQELNNYRDLVLDNYINEASKVTSNFNKDIMKNMSSTFINVNNQEKSKLSLRLSVAWNRAGAKAYKEISKEIRKKEREKTK